MKMTQLSVSSAILAAVLSGCSQQQVIGGSQVSGGSQQMAGGSQVTSTQAGSQQQVENAAPVVIAPRVIKPKPRIKNVMQPKKRIYKPAVKPRHSITKKGSGLPPAKPGQCFAKVKVPPKYITKTRKVLVQKPVNKRVLVRAPQYRWVTKKVLVRKPYYKTRVIPAQYKTTVKKVMVKPAYNTWRKGHGAITRIDNMTGEIMCRVTVPAVYKNVTQRVLVRPARTVRTLVPAVYKTIKQKRRVAPALYKTIHRPARYKTQNYRVKVGGARYVWRAVLCKTNAPKNYRKAAVQRKPVVRSTRKKQYRQSQGITYQEYLRVMQAKPKKPTAKKTSKKTVIQPTSKKSATVSKAPVKMKAPVVTKKAAPVQQKSKAETKKGIVYGIQQALKSKGFDPGTIDGKMGPGTAAALKAFQSSRGLPVGQLNKDTFRALGLIK